MENAEGDVEEATIDKARLKIIFKILLKIFFKNVIESC